jgi:hypothetical protein
VSFKRPTDDAPAAKLVLPPESSALLRHSTRLVLDEHGVNPEKEEEQATAILAAFPAVTHFQLDAICWRTWSYLTAMPGLKVLEAVPARSIHVEQHHLDCIGRLRSLHKLQFDARLSPDVSFSPLLQLSRSQRWKSLGLTCRKKPPDGSHRCRSSSSCASPRQTSRWSRICFRSCRRWCTRWWCVHARICAFWSSSRCSTRGRDFVVSSWKRVVAFWCTRRTRCGGRDGEGQRGNTARVGALDAAGTSRVVTDRELAIELERVRRNELAIEAAQPF